MRFAKLALPVVLSFAAVGCSEEVVDGSAAAASEVTSTASRECVIDTVVTEKGLLADFRDAVGPSFIKDYGGSFYPHVEIPGVFDAALDPSGEYGEWFYTVVGLDIEPEELPASATGRPRLTAVLSGTPTVDPLLATGARNFRAATAIFDAMTRAKETKEVHIVPPDHVYERSFVRTTRASAEGRVVCSSTVFPDSGPGAAEISCTFFGIERTHVQIFSSGDTGGKCLAETL